MGFGGGWGLDICDALEETVWDCMEDTLYVMDDTWIESYAAFNAGQQVIFDYHISVTLSDLSGYFIENWPWVEAWEYAEGMLLSYDFDVMERAFSDTIIRPVPTMEDLIGRAQQAQELLDFFCFF